MTAETPDRASDTVPVTAAEDEVNVAPFAGEVMLMVGGVLSSLTVTDVEALFPATSVAEPEIAWFAPSVATATGEGQVATPERESPQVKLTVTLELFQPAALGAGETAAAIVGGVLSILSVTLVEVLFPAASVAVPETTCLAPSVVIVCGARQLTTGEVASPQTNVTVTFVLFQPAAFGAGETVAVIVGRSLSTPIISMVRTPPGFPLT